MVRAAPEGKPAWLLAPQVALRGDGEDEPVFWLFWTWMATARAENAPICGTLTGARPDVPALLAHLDQGTSANVVCRVDPRPMSFRNKALATLSGFAPVLLPLVFYEVSRAARPIDLGLLALAVGAESKPAVEALLAHGAASFPGNPERSGRPLRLAVELDLHYGGSAWTELLLGDQRMPARHLCGVHSSRDPLVQRDDLRTLLEAGGLDIQGRDCGGRTYLHRAAAEDQTARVAALLQQDGIRVDLRDDRGRTPVLSAAAEGHWDIVWTLVDAGAPLTTPRVGGPSESLLRLAVIQGDNNVLERILAEGVPVDEPDAVGNNALAEAVRAGNQPAVRMLLEHGARLGERVVDGLVEDIVVAGDVAMLALLCDRGLSLRRRAKGGQSLVDLAWARRDLPMATLLVEHRAHLRGTGADGVSVALQEALAANDPQWLPLLLDYASAGVLDGALASALQSGDEALAEQLLKHGATGRKALIASALDGDLDRNAWLRARGVRYHAEALDDLVPDAGVEVVAQALADGAKVGGLALRKDRPMDHAIAHHSADLVLLLAEHGAAVPSRALEEAAEARDLAWVAVLVQAGGKPDPSDLRSVVRGDDAELLALLLSAGPVAVDALRALRRTARKRGVSSAVVVLLNDAMRESRRARRVK